MSNERGFAGMGVVLMLVVLGAIAVTGNMLYQEKSGTSLLDIYGSQAYQAARSGAEWGLYRSLQNGMCDASNTLSMPNTLSSYTVVVQCLRATVSEGNVSKTVDTITSTACNSAVCNSSGAEPVYVERQIQTMVVK